MNTKSKKTFSERNTKSKSQLLIIAEHAGNEIPVELSNLGLNKNDLRRHISHDIGVYGVCEFLSKKVKDQIILSKFSRLLVDLNRGINSPDCIRHFSDGSFIPFNIGLAENEKKSRIRKFYIPFHEKLSDIISTKKIKIIFSIHSFTPKLREENIQRPWHCGILYGLSEKLGNYCIDFLRHNYKFKVGNNEPYGVNNNDDYIISKFGDKKTIPSIIIEIRQDLISDYKGQKTWSEIIQNMIENCLYNYQH